MGSASQPLFRLLLRCAELKSLIGGRGLHAHVVKYGLWADVFLANSVVNVYARCGQLAIARAAFEEFDNRDVVSWNSLINSYSKIGHEGSKHVLELFGRMDVLPNAFTFAGVLTAASNAGGLGGREAHCVAVKMASCDDVFVGSSLVNMYSKMGLFSDARTVFDRIPARNSVTWATMITGYAAEKCGIKAFELFKSMVENGECEMNEFVLTSVLSALCLPEFIHMGRQVHGLTIKSGLVSVVSVGNSLVTFYAKCECMDDAIRMFETPGDKNLITWSAMITGYAQNGDPGKALKLFSEMHTASIRPSEFTFVGVLNACSDIITLGEGKQAHAYMLKLGFERQVYVRSALVDMYAKCGSVVDARRGFDQFPEADVVLWTSMIGGYVQKGEHEEALVLYGRMEKEGIMPNNLTIASVLKACSSLAALEQGKQIHACALKHGLSMGIPIGSALSTMYAKCGNLEDCSLVFRRMPQRDIVAWNSIMSGFSQNGRGNDALDLFKEMKSDGTQPDHVTFVNLLFACSHMGLVDEGWSYFRSMHRDHGLDPQVEHYACMVDLLSRAGKLEEAKEFIKSVPVAHGMCLWRTLLGACRQSRDFDVGAYAGERLMELGSTDSSAYILLSGIYAAQSRWEDVERVRRMMRLRGVSKEPGCSWVELKSRVHVFVVGEQQHPEIKAVYAEVRKLTKHMKIEGYRPGSTLEFDGSPEKNQETWDEEELRLAA